MPNGTYGGVRGRRKSSLLDLIQFIWSVFKEKFIFDGSSATRILIKGVGSNRSNILGS